MNISAIIVDDESDSRNVLKNLLGRFCENIEVVAEASNIKQAYELIIKSKPRVVFLDIQMPGGSGFDLLKKFNEVPFDVIFVTSYDKYAIDAIRLSALHYLMKPIEVSDLKEAIKRVEKSAYGESDRKRMIDNVISNSESVEKKISVHAGDVVVLLGLNEITHFEGEGNYTSIYTKNNEKYTSAKNMGEYEEVLKNYRQYIRIGKGCMVNINHVSNYSKGEPCTITISGRHTYEVSRRKKQELLELLKIKG